MVDSASWLQTPGPLYVNGPRLHEFLKEMKREAFDKFGYEIISAACAHFTDALQRAISIGELPDTPNRADVLSFISSEARELYVVIQFDLARIECDAVWTLLTKPWKLSEFKRITVAAQQLARHDAWVISYTENHDRARSVSRFASDSPEYRVTSAKMLCLYLKSLSGATIIHQGRESPPRRRHNSAGLMSRAQRKSE